MLQTLDSISNEVLNDIVFLTSEEKVAMLEFIATECAASIVQGYDVKIPEVKLIKIFFYLLTGHKIWNGKTVYSEKELDNILAFYDRAPDFIQSKIELLMEELKEEIFGPPQ